MTPRITIPRELINPLITKDLRTRMRGSRTFLLIFIHLFVLGFVMIIGFLVFQTSLTSPGSLEQRRFFGKALFGLLVWMELVMVSFVAPGMTSGSISSEYEHQTIELLKMTLLSSSDLILGKFLPGLGFVFLLLFTSIPLQGPAYLIGGVLWQEIIIATLVLMITAAAFCALGILLSTTIHRTIIAATLTYAFSIFLVFGIPIITLIFVLLFGATVPDGFGQIVQGREALLLTAGWLLLSITPLGAIIGTEVFFLNQNQLFIVQIPMNKDLILSAPSPWIPYLFLYSFLSIVALWSSSRKIKQVDH